MICILALLVSGMLGVFSASHRRIAKEALDCVFRRLTLRKCESRLDERIKSRVSGVLFRKNRRIARIVFRHFEIISWAFTILLVVSLAYLGFGFYNYVKYGNCNGPANSGAFCIFDPAGKNSQYSGIDIDYNAPYATPMPEGRPSLGSKNAKVTVIEFACFKCPYSKKAVPIVKDILSEFEGDVRVVFRTFPLDIHPLSFESAEAAYCAGEKGKFWEFHDAAFSKQDEVNTRDDLLSIASEIGINAEEFRKCLEEDRYREKVLEDFRAGIAAGVFGTPTFFLGDEKIVGPKKEKLEKEIRKALEAG